MFRDKAKYLVMSDDGQEIVDVLNPSAKLELLTNKIPRIFGAAGSRLQKFPIVFGGATLGNKCVVIGKPEKKMKMLEARDFPACVAINQSTLWIVGGTNNDDEPLSSSEFIKLDQSSTRGPDLPSGMYGHSMIQYNKESIYIIGGIQNGSESKKTWIADPTNGFKIKEGPSLNVGRVAHGCAKMSLSHSVEILNPTQNNPRSKFTIQMHKFCIGDLSHQQRCYCYGEIPF